MLGQQGQRRRRRQCGGSRSSSSRSTQLLQRLVLFLVLLSFPKRQEQHQHQNLHGLAVASVASAASSPMLSRAVVLFWKASHPFVGKVTKSALQRTRQAWSLKHPTTLLTSLQGIRTYTRSSLATATNITNTTSTLVNSSSSDICNPHGNQQRPGTNSEREYGTTDTTRPQSRRRQRRPLTNGVDVD